MNGTHPHPKLVLIPGGGMSSWAWDRLIPLLRADCLTIPTRLPVSTPEIRKKATVADCVHHILAQMDSAGFERAVIVGHSGGGILAGQLARHAPERVQHLVFLSANIPQDGHTSLHGLPASVRLLNLFAMHLQNRRNSTPLKRMEGIVRRNFCNTCPEDAICFMLEQELLTEPLCLIHEKICWSAFPPLPRTFIRLLQDRTISLAGQARMASNLAITDIRAIDSDHMVMLSRPQALADILHDILASIAKEAAPSQPGLTVRRQSPAPA
jgi:pimeloyl-ACP methyl ester carboxylesterase